MSNVNSEQISHTVLIFRLLNLNKINTDWVTITDLKNSNFFDFRHIFQDRITKPFIFAELNSVCLNAYTESTELNKMTCKFQKLLAKKIQHLLKYMVSQSMYIFQLTL